MTKPFRKYSLVILVLGALLCAALSGCNARKRNTAMSRKYTAFITKYNIHYNGDKHYRETLDEMEKSYEDDYTGLVLTHPAEAKGNEKAPQPTGDFTRSIEKAQKAIQLRSITKKPARKRGKSKDPKYKEWMKREEYNPFLHNDWLMMGRSQYMNGDFLGASATFFYTGRHFSWLPVTVTLATLSVLAIGVAASTVHDLFVSSVPSYSFDALPALIVTGRGLIVSLPSFVAIV